jgi:hypothetical protein
MSESKIIEVRASYVSENTFGFECPFCWSKYKKNGAPCANAKRIIHTHGTGGSIQRAIGKNYREPHCNSISEQKCTQFCIIIDENTPRK